MLLLLFVQNLFQFGAKDGKRESYYGEKNSVLHKVHVPIFFFFGGWQGRRTSHVPPSLPPPLIFKAKFKIFVTLPT